MMYKINRRNPIMMMTLNNLVRVQNMELSSALHMTVDPNIPNIPEPMMPPLFITGVLFIDDPRPPFGII